jgi:hypothetical protein
MAIIAVPVDWTIYEVDDTVIAFMNAQVQILPPFLVLESLVLNGKARRIGGETLKEPEGGYNVWTPEEETEEGPDNAEA